MNRFRRLVLVVSLVLSFSLAVLSQTEPAASPQKESKKQEPPVAKGKKNQRPAQEPAKPGEEEKKGGMNADTFSGLQFRAIGPSVASGRVIAFAVNPKNKSEYYVGVASGGVWKTVNDGTTWSSGLRERSLVLDRMDHA